jgi:hypothetical protein
MYVSGKVLYAAKMICKQATKCVEWRVLALYTLIAIVLHMCHYIHCYDKKGISIQAACKPKAEEVCMIQGA